MDTQNLIAHRRETQPPPRRIRCSRRITPHHGSGHALEIRPRLTGNQVPSIVAVPGPVIGGRRRGSAAFRTLRGSCHIGFLPVRAADAKPGARDLFDRDAKEHRAGWKSRALKHNEVVPER